MRAKQLRRRSGRALLAACVVSIAAAGTALGATRVLAENETLQACAHSETGLLRLVDDANECRNTEAAVEWSTQGPAGPAGPQGPKGETGPPGESGTGFAALTELEGKPCDLGGGKSGMSMISSTKPIPDSGFAAMPLYCVGVDRFEPNDTRASAVDLRPALSFSGFLILIGVTLFPAGNEDWFKLPGTTFYRFTVGNPEANLDIYRDGVLVADDLNIASGGGTYINDQPGPHDWELHFTSLRAGRISPLFFSAAP